MTASAGARPSAPRAANEVAINPVAVLLCSTAVTARADRHGPQTSRSSRL
jgi:hypothetical protein